MDTCTHSRIQIVEKDTTAWRTELSPRVKAIAQLSMKKGVGDVKWEKERGEKQRKRQKQKGKSKAKTKEKEREKENNRLQVGLEPTTTR